MSDEYNLNNPSVTDEEKMIQDKKKKKYLLREAESKAYYKSLEDDYYKAMEDNYFRALEECHYNWMD